MNQKELTEWFSQQNIQEVEVIVPDIAGVARGKLVPEDKFLNDSAIRLPESVFIQTVTGEFLNEPVINPADRDIILKQGMFGVLNLCKALSSLTSDNLTLEIITDKYFNHGSFEAQKRLKQQISTILTLNNCFLVFSATKKLKAISKAKKHPCP